MKATEDLVHEHNAVLVALQVLEKVAAAITAKDDKAPLHLEPLLDFLKGFVDRCHHGKEEDVLFPELERRGVKSEGCPIGVMLSEHEVDPGHVRALVENLERLRGGDAGATAKIGEHAHAYRDMLQAHINKDNNVPFLMADRFVPEGIAAHLAKQFDAIERDRAGEGKHKAYHAMLTTLKGIYGVD